MTDERLYIDGELVDIDTDTKITLNVNSNLFRDVSKIVSNNTYTVRLPKTVRNQRLLKHADIVQSKDEYAYKMHDARYFRNGVEVIKNGRATVLQVTEDAIEITILWGLFSQFNELLNKDIALNELDTDDRIYFQSLNEPNDYEVAKGMNYFYAYYDVWVRNNDWVDTWNSGGNATYPIVQGYDIGFTYYGGKEYILNDNNYIHPCAQVFWILELIRQKTGVLFEFDQDAREYINTLVIPLIAKKANRLTYEEGLTATLQQENGQGKVEFVINKANSLFNEGVGVNDILTVKDDAKIAFNINIEWAFNNNYSFSWINPPKSDGVFDYYTYDKGQWLSVIVDDGTEEKEYIVGNNKKNFEVKVPHGYTGEVRFSYSGYGNIDVKQGSTVRLKWDGNNLFANKLIGGNMTLSVSAEGGEVMPNSYYPITSNLPNIKVLDFIKFLSVITGTFPLQIADDKKITFVSYNKIADNISRAIDWTSRVIAHGENNKAKDISFRISDYCKHNYYRWKQEDSVGDVFDGVLNIDDDTLPLEREVITFPFAPTVGNNIPIYKRAEKTEDEEEKQPEYSACSDRIMRVHKDSSGKAELQFDIYMQDIIDEKYKLIKSSFERMKIIKEYVRLRDIEILSFDETIPVYLAQHGAYFAVINIKSDNYGIAEVELLRINRERI